MRPGAVLPLGQLALLGADHVDAPLDQEPHVRLRRRVLPHADVHRRGDEHGAADGERRLGEDVVGQAVRELRQRVRGERRDHEQVRVGEMRVEVARRLLARERLERVGRDEALGVGREHRRHVVTVLHEQPDELARLVGGDPAGHPYENPSHLGPAQIGTTRCETVILPSAISSRAMVR